MAKLRNLFPLLCALYAASAGAQGALDLYTISQTDLRGSARFMSMAGAFGALGAQSESWRHRCLPQFRGGNDNGRCQEKCHDEWV